MIECANTLETEIASQSYFLCNGQKRHFSSGAGGSRLRHSTISSREQADNREREYKIDASK